MKKYYVYYDIQQPYYDGEKVSSAEDFVKFFDEDPAADIELHINSYGGEIKEALSMLSAIERHTGRVVAYIDGVAASCASWLALAADEVHIAKNAEIFIHRAHEYLYADAPFMEKEAVLLRSYDDRIIGIYKAKALDEGTDFGRMMTEETTLPATEAAKVWNLIVDDTKEVPTSRTRCMNVLAKCTHKPAEPVQEPEEDNDIDCII